METVGLPNEEIPLMKEIKTTDVKSAWNQKKKRSKEDSDDNNRSGECSVIIDLLSLIPPQILNKRANGDDSDTSIEEIEAEVVNDIQNINIEDDGVNVQEDMDEGVDDDSTPENDTAENEVNESIPRGHKNDTAENSTCEIKESENVDNINILQVITSRLLNSQRSKKWKDLEITPEMLFTDILNYAPNVQKFIVKELDMIAEVYHEYTGHSMPFKKCDSKGTKINIISQTFGDKVL